MRKLLDHITIILFGAFIAAIFLLYLLLPQTEFSDVENRYLTLRPKISFESLAKGSFMTDFDSYTAEQLPFRNAFVKLKALTEKFLLKKENNNIVEGSDSYLFEKLSVVNERLTKNEEIIKSFAKENDRRINVAIVPNSFEILKEKVPRGLPLVDEKKEIDKFYKDLEAFENVKTVDLYPKLLETSGEGKQVYYRTDHHWTTAAAYEGYKVICREMGIAPSSFETVKKGSIRDFYGTYYAKYKGIFIKADTIEYYDIPVDSYLINEKDSFDSLYDEDKAKIYDKYAFFLRGNYGLAVIKGKGQKRGRDLIVIKDSYGNCLIPFLTMDYDSITVLDLRYYGGSVKKLLDEKKDQDILLLYNFAHLNEDNNFYKLIK